MLVLSRHADEGILIGDDVLVTVLSLRGNKVRLGISAPPEVGIIRAELPGFGCGGSGGSGMLVLSRKVNEGIRIGDTVTLKVIKISGKSVRLGIDAPKDVSVLRAELRNAA